MLTGAVVVVWRDYLETEASLLSLAAMWRAPDIVVCVVQECSGEFRRRLEALSVPGLEVIERQDNLGFAAAANLGMARALSFGAEWVLLLNNDATADPGCLAACLDEATSQPGVAVAGPAVRIMDRPEQLWFAGGVHSELFAFTRHRALGGPASQPPPSADTGYVSGCCALIAAAAWRQLGAFEEDFFLYYEDVEWCHRARQAGWRCRYVGATLCSHALGVSSGQRGSLGLSDNTAYYLARNPLRFAVTTPSPLLRATRVVGILSVWGLYNLWRLRAAGSWRTLRSYLEGTRDAFVGRMGRRPTP